MKCYLDILRQLCQRSIHLNLGRHQPPLQSENILNNDVTRIAHCDGLKQRFILTVSVSPVAPRPFVASALLVPKAPPAPITEMEKM